MYPSSAWALLVDVDNGVRIVGFRVLRYCMQSPQHVTTILARHPFVTLAIHAMELPEAGNELERQASLQARTLLVLGLNVQHTCLVCLRMGMCVHTCVCVHVCACPPVHLCVRLVRLYV